METTPDNPLTMRLEKDPAVIYMLDRDLRIVYCNEAWDRFAAENGGRGLERERQFGQPVMDVIPQPLRRFFKEGYEKVLFGRETWEFTYECSSARVYRTFRAMVYPAPLGEELVVVNSLSVARPHQDRDRKPFVVDERLYVDPNGIVTVCCHCRRTCRASERSVWDWVPSYLAQPPQQVSHGICEVCRNLFYPDVG